MCNLIFDFDFSVLFGFQAWAYFFFIGKMNYYFGLNCNF